MQKHISDPEEGRLDLTSASVGIKQGEDIHTDGWIDPRTFAVKICLGVLRLCWGANDSEGWPLTRIIPSELTKSTRISSMMGNAICLSRRRTVRATEVVSVSHGYSFVVINGFPVSTYISNHDPCEYKQCPTLKEIPFSGKLDEIDERSTKKNSQADRAVTKGTYRSPVASKIKSCDQFSLISMLVCLSVD